MLKHLLFFLLLIGGSYYYWTTRPVVHGPGVVAPKEPVQQEALGIKDFDHKTYKIRPVARFHLEARVLSKERYGDQISNLAPYDFIVGWGPMSDERNLDYILIKQSDRSFHWEMTKPPIPQYKMMEHTANVRFIPPNQVIRDKLAEVRRGHIIKVKGYLVNVEAAEGWNLKTSLTRSDIGREAAEVVWIEEFVIL